LLAILLPPQYLSSYLLVALVAPLRPTRKQPGSSLGRSRKPQPCCRHVHSRYRLLQQSGFSGSLALLSTVLDAHIGQEDSHLEENSCLRRRNHDLAAFSDQAIKPLVQLDNLLRLAIEKLLHRELAAGVRLIAFSELATAPGTGPEGSRLRAFRLPFSAWYLELHVTFSTALLDEVAMENILLHFPEMAGDLWNPASA
jgi:hypothetical protein